MSKRINALLLLVLVSLFIIPSAFAADNATDSLAADSNTFNLTDSYDIYFDSGAVNDTGEGTPDSPYKELRDGRILDNSVIHLKNGVYNYSQLNSHTNVSFIGEDVDKTIVDGHGGMILIDRHMTLCNVTFCNLNIFNQGNLVATNVVFTNSSAIKTGKYDDRYGGAIYCVSNTHNAYITNCTFTNNDAGYGGAIYLSGGILEINDCAFINNTAYNYGGAIACDSSKYSSSRITVKKSRFINDMALNDAGGAVYLREGTFFAEDVNVTSCNSTFGGALALLKTDANLKGVNLTGNSAKYDGGALYQLYGNLTLKDSTILENHARYGGGLYCDNLTLMAINNVSLSYNSAQAAAGAIYSLLNTNVSLVDVTYLSNTAAAYDDFYNQDSLSLTLTSSNYTLYHYDVGDSALPSSYMSAVTPVKNQENGGNCWAFAVLGALESAILKVSGETVILSEENVKNLASLYSNYGWSMDTNQGGYDDMGVGYLLSWLGPVLQSDDEYDGLTTLSPVLESILHVQNMVYLKRTSYYGQDSIKKAIRDYGGIYASICMMAHYDSSIKKYVQCYRGSGSRDHAVVLVGWDDDFYMPEAPGKGAWIAKNSWGENWGNDGYFYVSYFDNSCLKIGDDDAAFAFILNDTMKYDKNYQYDIAKTDYFFNTTKTVWYKNIFNATDDEYLAAVSTYFEKQTQWTLQVRVNGVSRMTMYGSSNPGYRTIDLDSLIPLSCGDEFEITFKITVDKDAGVPISERISLNNCFYRENISFISYDGVNWRDMFKINWTYPDHTYDSQVACIKAFTVLNPIGTALTLGIEERTSDKALLVARVLNEWGRPVNCGKVSFTVGSDTYISSVVNGIAKWMIPLETSNITAEFTATGYEPSNETREMLHPLLSTTITLSVTGQHNPINITANVCDANGNPAKSGSVTFVADGKTYVAKVVGGVAKIENVYVAPERLTVFATFTDNFSYASSSVSEIVEISRIGTTIHLDIEANEANNPVNVTAHVLDLDNNPVNSGRVTFNMAGKVYVVEVSNGTANIFHTFTRTGANTVTASYDDEYVYNSSSFTQSLTVSKMKVNMTFQNLIDESTSVFVVQIRNSTVAFRVTICLNGKNSTYSSKDDYALFELKDLEYGTYNYTIRLISDIYEAADITGQFNITCHKTEIIAPDVCYYNGEYAVVLKDSEGNVLADKDIYLKVYGNTSKKRTDSNGMAVFSLPLSIGFYGVTINFIGDDEYLKSKATINVEIKSTVDFLSYTYTYNSNYRSVLHDASGNPASERQVNVAVDGTSHKAVTDKNGQISLIIKLNPGSHVVIITNPLTGEVKSQTISVVKRITGNKGFTMYYRAGKSYTVRVFDDNGKAAKNVKVAFTINGKTYYRWSDSNGYASFKINANPGKYWITAEYKGFKVKDKITVKPTIVTGNVKVKRGKVITFKAKLLNTNGKVMKYKKLVFKFKSKTYKIKTNRNGIAVLKINKKYRAGSYKIVTSYGNIKVKNWIKIRK